jgi:hypothetical protein
MHPSEPLFTPLQYIAAEVGVDPQTICRRPADFFRTVKLGGQRYAATSVYRAWLRQHLEAAGESARNGDRAA